MRVVADSHAIFWYLQSSAALSSAARQALQEAEATDGVIVSAATVIDLWYVTQTTKKISSEALGVIRAELERAAGIRWEPVTAAIADESTRISRATLSDPWDRLIVATARILGVPLVTRDEAITSSRLVDVVW